MSLFAVIASQPTAEFEKRISDVFGNKHYRVNDTVWIVSASGETTRQVSVKVGFNTDAGDRGGDFAPGIVLSIDNYWGRYNKNLWEWMRVALETNGQ